MKYGYIYKYISRFLAFLRLVIPLHSRLFFLFLPQKIASQSQNFIIRQQENFLHEDLLACFANSKAYTSE